MIYEHILRILALVLILLRFIMIANAKFTVSIVYVGLRGGHGRTFQNDERWKDMKSVKKWSTRLKLTSDLGSRIRLHKKTDREDWSKDFKIDCWMAHRSSCCWWSKYCWIVDRSWPKSTENGPIWHKQKLLLWWSVTDCSVIIIVMFVFVSSVI